MVNRHARHAPPKVRRKRKWLALCIVVPLLMGGAAFAFFDLNTATSHVNVAATPSFTITIGNPAGDPLAPGVGSETVTYTATNQLTHPQTISSETFAVTSDSAGGIFDTATNAFNDSCLAVWFSTSTSDPGTTFPLTLQPSQSTGGTIGVTMPENDTTRQDACEGTSPAVSVTLN